MNWTLAIERNRDALKRLLATLVAMAGLRGRFAPEAQSCRAGGTTTGREGLVAAGGSGPPAERWPQIPPEGSGRPTTGAGPAAFGSSRPLDAFRHATGMTDFGLRPIPASLPRHLHRAVLRLLRPAESAARRLVIVAARGVTVQLPPPRPRKPKPNPTILRNGPKGRNGTGIVMPRYVPHPELVEGHPEVRGEPEPRRKLCLPLFDRLRRPSRPFRPAASSTPRICFPGFGVPSPVPVRRPPDAYDLIDAGRLSLRLAALAAALDDLPAQARRFARWRAARDAAGTPNNNRAATGAQNRRPSRIRRIWPLRPGRPPGLLKRPVHDVHDLLNDIHSLAFSVLDRPDTS